jgi:hypothetical protein
MMGELKGKGIARAGPGYGFGVEAKPVPETQAMPHSRLVRRILLPELELTNSWYFSGFDHTHLEVRKTSKMEVCPAVQLLRW